MVKLSYYFPVSSDSVSLKKQLLESGVLDITNETMYRMAPEAVDPSILSRGSLSYRRYTRSALLMLRDDVLSKKNPKCLKDSRLLKFSFWKLNNKNFTITDESTITAPTTVTTGTTGISAKTETTATTTSQKSIYDKNSLNIRYRNNNNNYRYNFDGHRRQYSNKYNGGGNIIYNDDNNNSQFRYNSREGRFLENSSETKSYTNKDHYISSYNGKINENNLHQQRWNSYESRNNDHSNIRTSSYMMPNYFKQKYDKSENNNYNMKFYNGEKDHYHHYRTEYKIDKKLMSSEMNDQNDPKNYNIDEISSNRNSFYKNSENNNGVTERFGSGRLPFSNKNWNNNQLEKKFDFNSSDGFLNNSKKHPDMYYNHNKNSGHYYHNNNYHNNNFNYHQYHSRHRKDSGSSSAQSFNSEEPEWLSCGPTSQNDVIELRGFDDDLDNIEENDNDKESITAEKKTLKKFYTDLNSDNGNVKKIEQKIPSDTNSTIPMMGKKLEIQINGTSVTSAVSVTSNSNDEIQSVCTSTAPSPPPARSTPTKLLNMNLLSNNQKLHNQVDVKVNGNNNSTTNDNKKNYYSLQFNFDNFLDYDTINNILGNNSKSRSSHWFKNHHNVSHHNNDSKGIKHNLSTIEKKNFKQQERYPKSAINVKDLEEQMRKIGYQKYFSHSNNNYINNNHNHNHNLSHQFKNDQEANSNQHHSSLHLHNSEQQQSPIKASVNAFTQSAYKQMLAQANLIVRQAQDPEVFRRFIEQINSMNQIAALSQLSKPLLLQQPLFTVNNGKTQKRIPSMRELEFHTKNIVQNALFRKHLQEQQKLRLQELQQLTLQSNINPNAPEFTPTSVLRKMSAEKESFSSMPSTNMEMENKFFDENSLLNKTNKFSTFLNQQNMFQQQQHQQPNQNLSELIQQNNSLIFNNFNRFTNKYSDTSSKKIGEKHIKWDNDYLHYIPTNKPSTGRPILKGSNTNFTSKTQNSQFPSILKQQQQNEEKNYGFDHFLKTKSNFQNNNNQISKFNESTQFPSSSSSISGSNWFSQSKFNHQNQKQFPELESTNTATVNPFLIHGKPTVNLIKDDCNIMQSEKENNKIDETPLQNIGNHSNSEASK